MLFNGIFLVVLLYSNFEIVDKYTAIKKKLLSHLIKHLLSNSVSVFVYKDKPFFLLLKAYPCHLCSHTREVALYGWSVKRSNWRKVNLNRLFSVVDTSAWYKAADINKSEYKQTSQNVSRMCISVWTLGIFHLTKYFTDTI